MHFQATYSLTLPFSPPFSLTSLFLFFTCVDVVVAVVVKKGIDFFAHIHKNKKKSFPRQGKIQGQRRNACSEQRVGNNNISYTAPHI